MPTLPGDLTDDAHRLSALRRIEDETLRQSGNQIEFFLLLNEHGEALFVKQGRQRAADSGGTQHEVDFTAEELAPFVRERRS